MDNKKKLIIAISALIVIIIVIILLVIKLVSINNSKNNEIENMNAEIGGNTAEENIIEDNNIVEDNNTEEQLPNNGEQGNEEDNIQTTPIADPEQEVDKQTIQKQESDQEKAMNIAKKDWGEDSSVYFSFEGVNNGKYTVAVRETETTHTVRYYYINVATGTFDIEE